MLSESWRETLHINRLSFFFFFLDSGHHLLNGFHFFFIYLEWRDTENQQLLSAVLFHLLFLNPARCLERHVNSAIV